MFKTLKLVIIMPGRIEVGYFLLEFLIIIFIKNCNIPQFSVILVNFMSFKQPEVRGVRLLETKCVIFARGVRLLESVRLLERIRQFKFIHFLCFLCYSVRQCVKFVHKTISLKITTKSAMDTFNTLANNILNQSLQSDWFINTKNKF